MVRWVWIFLQSVTEWKMDQKRMSGNHSDSDINEDLTSLVVNVDLGGSL